MPLVTRILVTLAAVLALAPIPSANAHPDDEFCGRDSGMDPALCAELAAMDRAEPDAGNTNPYAKLSLSVAERGAGATFARYLFIGIQHIVPGGTDHILFVIGLLLGVRRKSTLFWLISAFTLAHGVALLGAVSGWVTPPSAPIEIAIAATIAWVGLENLLWQPPRIWRYALVFAFGLIHGFGFAGFISELGLPDAQLGFALLGFNLGVEIGQCLVVGALAVIAFAALAQRTDIKRQTALTWLRLVGSLAIAAVGATWVVQRALAV